MKRLVTIILAAAITTSLVVPCGAQTVPAASELDRLIDVLKSDADYQAKATACRQLSYIGTEKVVAPLAALLCDEKLSHMACYALEPMPYKAVDDALLTALDQAEGMALAGIIGSIGVRGDARAVAPLSKLLTAADADVVEAAARALGSIGTVDAGKALTTGLAAAPAARKWAFYEGLLRCAERLAAAGQAEAALAIYDVLRTSDAPHHVRAGGVRGAILARQGRQRGLLLREYLGSEDYIAFAAAVQATHSIAGERVTQSLAGALAGASADKQILILQALAQRDDASALEAVYSVAKSGAKPVRLAAIKAVPDISETGGAGLVDLMFDADGDVARAAQESFAAMKGADADAIVLDMLESGDNARQLKALELMGRRRIRGVASALFRSSRDDNEAVRAASISLLGDMAEAKQFPMLVDLLLRATSRSEIRAAERAISRACTREARLSAGKVVIRKAIYGAPNGNSVDVTKKVAKMVEDGMATITASNANFGDPAQGIVKQLQLEYAVDGVAQTVTVAENETATLAVAVVPEAFVDVLCSAAAKASGEQKAALLRLLKSVGTPRALGVIVAATKDADAAIADEAVSLLCGWPTADALPEILKLTAASGRTQILAVRGALRLIPLQAVSDEQKLAAFKDLTPRVVRVEEKRLLLGALGQVTTAGSLAMVAPYLDDAATKNEASLAVVTIADAILKGPDAAGQARGLIEPLEKAGGAANADVAKRAKTLLAEAKKRAG
jgi:HEAT repeat protein